MTATYGEVLARLSAPGPKLVLLHANADADAVGSGVALHLSFPEVSLAAPLGLGRSGKTLLSRIGVQVPLVVEADAGKFGTLIVPDASTPDMVGNAVPPDLFGRVIVIDHHQPSGEWNGTLTMCDPSASSAGELVARLIAASGRTVAGPAALALLAAIIADSSAFRRASPETLRLAADLAERAGGLDRAFALLDDRPDDSQRIAHLKALQRLRFDTVQAGGRKVLVASTVIGAFEASAALLLLRTGADIAFAGSQRKEEFSVSGRATGEMVEAGLNLAALLDEVGKEVGGKGGGHAGAAAVRGVGDAEAVVNIAVERAKNVVRG